MQLPIGAEGHYRGVVDLVEMNAIVWDRGDDLGASFDVVDIPEELVEDAAEWRHKLIDVLSLVDESIADKFLMEEEITAEDLRVALRKGTVTNEIVPVLNGTAFKNKGVQPLLDAVVAYLPSPVDLPPVQGMNLKGTETVERKPSDHDSFAALAFKIMTAPHVGKLTYFRIYSGQIDKGGQLLNTRTGNKERVGRILEMHANNQEDVETARTGDIVAAIGLKNVKTGDTLCDAGHPIVLEELVFPEPVIHVAVEPKTKADQDKMSKALAALSEEDPTFQVRTDHETGQTVISGMGELHLEVLVDRMLREFKVDAAVGKPQVAYRETITRAVQKVEYRHVKQTGGSGPVRRRRHQPRAHRPRWWLRVRRQDHRRAHPQGVHPRRRPGHPGGADGRGARRLPDRRRAGHARRRPVPRRRLLGDGLQDRRLTRVQEGRRAGQARAARADHAGRGGHPRRVHG